MRGTLDQIQKLSNRSRHYSNGKEKRKKQISVLLTLFVVVVCLFIYIVSSLLHQTSGPSTSDHPSNSLKYSSLVHDKKRWKKFAFAVKTGRDIVRERVPTLLSTFLKDVPNKILIGDAPGIVVDGVPMIDVYTHLYDGLKNEDGSDISFDIANKAKTAPSSLDVKELVPDEDSLGWKSDTHKNLPGFRELLKRYPDAEWFMMIDDDSYVFMENLDSFVSSYNSSLAYYFGAGNTFTHCDSVMDWRHSTIFAHGGSGILISRGAMLRLEKVWDFCIVRYHNCWAGDVKLGLCLRNEGVLLTNVKKFHTNPPNDKTVYAHPCSRPITFHHLLKDQILKLHTLERKVKYVNMQDLMHDWIDSAQKENTNRKGDEFKFYDVGSLQDCISLCKNNPKCFAYSFKDRLCVFKSKINELVPEQGTVSGVMSSNFICDSTLKEMEAEYMDLGL